MRDRAKLRRCCLGVSLVLLLAGCAQDRDAPAPRNVWVGDGPAVACISTSRIRSTRIVDDRTIDFETTGSRVYRNALPFRCSGLMFNQSIRHNSRTSQLCTGNSITPRGVGGSTATCSLGRFQPMRRVPVPDVPAG